MASFKTKIPEYKKLIDDCLEDSLPNHDQSPQKTQSSNALFSDEWR